VPFSSTKLTRSPSLRDLNPLPSIAEKCTNTSLPPSLSMNPKPLLSLNHFTLPSAIVDPFLIFFVRLGSYLRIVPIRRKTDSPDNSIQRTARISWASYRLFTKKARHGTLFFPQLPPLPCEDPAAYRTKATLNARQS